MDGRYRGMNDRRSIDKEDRRDSHASQHRPSRFVLLSQAVTKCHDDSSIRQRRDFSDRVPDLAGADEHTGLAQQTQLILQLTGSNPMYPRIAVIERGTDIVKVDGYQHRTRLLRFSGRVNVKCREGHAEGKSGSP